MRKQNKLFIAVISTALFFLFSISGCTKTTAVEVDESGYLGTYYGQHFLADSTTLRVIVGASAVMVYDDTLLVTNGGSTTDGKVKAKSSLLGGNTIEIDVTTGIVTPVFLGDVYILSTTLKNVKFNTGSTATWNAAKTNVTTHLNASVNYDFGGTLIPLTPVIINGVFVKQ